MTDLNKKITQQILELIIAANQILVNEVPGDHKIKIGEIDIKRQKNPEPLKAAYNKWYSVSLPLVRQILPDRLDDFIEYYKTTKPRKEIGYLNYNISDYLIGLTIKRNGERIVNSEQAFSEKLQNQIAILQSGLTRINSILANITDVIQAAFFDTEIETAKELLKKKHLRAAGAIAGVILEKHFEKVIDTHQIKITKKVMHLSDYLELLKNNNLIDTPNWRFLQRLADIRNYCVHSKEREPTTEEVEELLNGTDKVIKTIH